MLIKTTEKLKFTYIKYKLEYEFTTYLKMCFSPKLLLESFYPEKCKTDINKNSSL